VEKALPEIKAKYPEISFEIVDTQKGLIKTSIKNMSEALRDSVIMTVSVIFLTLASLRLASLAAVSIPLACFMAFAGMYVMGNELNIVTMTAIILSVGLLVDDSIVVIENIQRHVIKLKKPIKQAIIDGLNEIVLADWAGTFTTVIVLVPIMFVGGYSQKILRPLTIVLSLTLLSSFIVSVTVIPLLAKYMAGKRDMNIIERFVKVVDRFIIGQIRDFFVSFVGFALRHRLFFIILAIALFVISLRQMPLIGRDLMPAMDTGIIKIDFKVESNLKVDETENIAEKIAKVVASMPGFKYMSLEVGTEPGVISFGSTRTPQQGIITAHFVDRFHRKQSIWEIEEKIQKKALLIPGVASLGVYDYGATPFSSIAAPVDVMISGPDMKVLDSLANEVEKRLYKVKGLTSIMRSWRWDKKEVAIFIDPKKAAFYETDPSNISSQIRKKIEGVQTSTLRVNGEDGYIIRVRYQYGERNSIEDTLNFEIKTPKGLVPLREFVMTKTVHVPTVFTRNNLMPVIDIYGYRTAEASISHLHQQIVKALKDVKLPKGYKLTYEGEYKNMGQTGQNMGKALAIAVILLFFALVITFNSWINPLVIMLAIPLALIGVVWGLLIIGRHMCMPATMGFILLAGIVVNNSILLIDFIENARKKGEDLITAIQKAVMIRTRPIVMTVTCTVVGMWPIAAQRAIGLERLSPLAVVAIGGLIVSTILTLIYVPIFYSLIENIKVICSNILLSRRKH
jgi:multidrug efflux pump subunit AcrB